MSFEIKKDGAWVVLNAFQKKAEGLAEILDAAVLAEAHFFRTKIIEGLTEQAPGGVPIKPPADETIRRRQAAGFGGTKALIVRADLRNSVSVVKQGGEVFIGVLRKATGRTGQSLANIAEMNELGAIIARPTKRGISIQTIPARPFLRPAFEAFAPGAGQRFLERVAKKLGL